MTESTKITSLTYFQALELRAIAIEDPLLGLTVTATTATVPHPQETLDKILGNIAQISDRGRKNALHSVKRKIQKAAAV